MIGLSFVADAPLREGIALAPAQDTETTSGVDGARTVGRARGMKTGVHRTSAGGEATEPHPNLGRAFVLEL